MLQAGPNSWIQVTLSPQPPRSGRNRCERYSSDCVLIILSRDVLPGRSITVALGGCEWDLEDGVYSQSSRLGSVGHLAG